VLLGVIAGDGQHIVEHARVGGRRSVRTPSVTGCS
jgi:hypothetical protein